MHALMDGIPLDRMNTSMTINATAAWLLALYLVVAEENGIEPSALSGTTQNDIIKEYLSRGTYAFPPGPSMRLIADSVAYTVEHVPRWNPVNICSYHLQEAGATPVQEIAYAMSTAIAVLDAVRERVPEDRMGAVFGRLSFFVNAGVRFVEEHAKLRAMALLWDELGERYGVADERQRRFRYGVQVNSLGLTEAQPENNVQRIVLEALAVTLGRSARARAIQLTCLERGARPSAAVGPAVVAADPAGARLRDRPARVPRPVRGLAGDGRAGGGAARGRPGRDGAGGRAGRRGRGCAVHEGGAGGVAPRADRPHRVRRAGDGRRQPLRGDRALAADRGRRHPRGRPGGGAGGARGAGSSGGRRATAPRWRRHWPSCDAWRRATRT